MAKGDIERVRRAAATAERVRLVRTKGVGISINHADAAPLGRLPCLGEAGWEVRRPTAAGWTHIGDFGGGA